MNLQMNAALCAPYRSNCQRARVVTEDWAERSLFCVCCDNDHLSRASHNTPAIDFSCRECSAGYQLKSTKRWSENRITDAGYAAMIRQIRSDRVPNLFVLGYDPTW